MRNIAQFKQPHLTRLDVCNRTKSRILHSKILLFSDNQQMLLLHDDVSEGKFPTNPILPTGQTPPYCRIYQAKHC
jgi:hypothetical protein